MYMGRGVLRLAALLAGAVLLWSCAVPEASPTPEPVPPTATVGSEAPAQVTPEVSSTPEPVPPTATARVETPTPPEPTPTTLQVDPGNPCGLAPVVAPTPAQDPGYTRLDRSTGLHVTGSMQLIDPVTYRLRVAGKVEPPLELTYDEIRCLPKVQASPVLNCPGFFVDEATWAGTPIAEILALTQVQEGASTLEFVSADGYKTSLPLEMAQDRANFLAYEWEGEPLPRLHGFPLRVVIPGAQGNQWTKWLVEINVE
jgi:DMSO/TMAO reductase YedYZ molybdopterin-dependent catalytic subunit